MTSLKKIISVVLTAVMMFGVLSSGIVGVATDIDLEAKYVNLAAALKNEYVADLTNYTISNSTLNNGKEGFDTDANGFAYEHRVTAKDNKDSDILRAANRFYYLAESLISTEYGVGLYDPALLFTSVTAHLHKYFEGSTEPYYEDFYGKRYYPTEEELQEYERAISLLDAVGREPTAALLTSFRVYFMQKDEYSLYHVDTILQYFLGNALRINAGNWYHRFAFAVETSLDTWLIDAGKDYGDINNLYDNTIVLRKAVYAFEYKRTFNETKTKAYYSFKQPSLATVYENYANEFGFSDVSADLTRPSYYGANDDITKGGQAEALMIKQVKDTTTIPNLRSIYALFAPIRNTVTAEAETRDSITIPKGSTWDYYYSKLDESGLAAQPNAETIIAHIDELGVDYSNDALLAMFGKEIGNMFSFAYNLKPRSSLPERTVRGNAKYTVTADHLDRIVTDIDNLVHNSHGTTAVRVATIVKQFFNTNSSLFEGTAVQGLDFDDLKDLVSHLLNGLLFRDSIINMLVGLVYPLVCNLVDSKLLEAVTDAVGSTISGWVGNILNDLLENNDLAIYPKQLGDRINLDHPGKYDDAVAVLRAAGSNWENVNMDALSWGVDDANLSEKASVFTDALCTALGGFRLLLITVMCGDAAYKNDKRKKGKGDNGLSWLANGEDNGNNQFTEYYDKLLINIAQQGVIMRSQGGYTKLVIPLLRLFPEMNQLNAYSETYKQSTTPVPGFLSSKAYHDAVDADGDNCLRMIIKPIVYWVTNVLADHPFSSLWKLLPNLINFFVRTSPMDEHIGEYDVWCNGTSNDASHNNFDKCQTLSLAHIMEHVHLKVTGLGLNIYHESIMGFLGDKKSMLESLNGLLNALLKLQYIKGKTGVMLPCAYTDGETIVLKDSAAYVSDPDAYPTELLYCYADENEIEYVFEEDEDHPVRIENPEYQKESFKLPQIQEKKITDPSGIGTLNTDWNTIDVQHPGVVMLYVLRFVITSLGYRYDISDGAENPDLPDLIKCFLWMKDYKEERDERTGQMVRSDFLTKDLFQGLKLEDIVTNVMLHPDDALAALLELFYSNEPGNRYESIPYTYSINEINYHNNVLLNREINPSLTYGTPVRYTKYWTREYARKTLGNSGELIQNILVMLGKDEFKDGFGPFIENLLNEKVFNDSLVNKAFNTIYQLLSGLNDKVGFDIATVLDAVYNITFNPSEIGKTLDGMLGYATGASQKLKTATSWNTVFNARVVGQDALGNDIVEIEDVYLDWGVDTAGEHGLTAQDAFVRVMSALLSPAAFAFRFLFRDENIQLLGLLELDAYAGYQYAWIALLEAFSCPNIMSYRSYYEDTDPTVAPVVNPVGTKLSDARVIYDMMKPLLGLIDKVYADPITTVLDLIPNLLFFISIGGLNDLLNNLVHFAYVLLDILKPIINGYDLLDGLLSNIEIKGYKLNLSLPLDIDFNALINDLISLFVGDSINLGGMQISLPYIDFHTLCCGSLTQYFSAEGRNIVRLDSAEGADLLTAVLRLVFEVLFMEENKTAVTNLIMTKVGVDENGNPKLDSYDRRTLLQLLDQLYTLMETYEVPDMLLFVIYQLVTKLTPLSGSLARSLSASGMTIKDVFSNISDPKSFIAILSQLADGMNGTSEEGTVSKISAFGKLIQKLKEFFEKIIKFFKKFSIKSEEAG